MSAARAQGPGFPRELKVALSAPRFEAVGRRAQAQEIDGRLRVTIDGIVAEVRVDAGEAGGGAIEVWPFGAERVRGGPAARTERVFVAPDHPLVVLEWSCAERGAMHVRIDAPNGMRVIAPGAVERGSGVVALDIEPGRAVRVVLTTMDDLPDVDGLLGAAIARARRRMARRPRLIETRDDGLAIDPLAEADHGMRAAALAKTGDAIATHASRDESAGVAIALLGLNDREPARDLIEAGGVSAADVALAGAWVAWTGDAAPLAARWSELSEAIRALADDGAAGADVWARVALALAPAFADMRGDRALDDVLRRMPDRPDPAAALAAAGAELRRRGRTAAIAAGAALEVLHGALGIVPDAPRGRVRLAPRVGGTRIELGGVALGDAVFAMRVEPDAAGRVRIVVEQTAGAVPHTAIVEPHVPWRRLTSASVDGVKAALDSSDEAGGLRVRVQVVADHAREIVLDLE